jgi:hypothetical protein
MNSRKSDLNYFVTQAHVIASNSFAHEVGEGRGEGVSERGKALV